MTYQSKSNPVAWSGMILTIFSLVVAPSARAQAPVAQAAPLVPPPPPAPPPKWTGSAATGLTLTTGNSKTLLFTLTGRGERKWNMNEVGLGADAAYGKNQGVKNNETLGGFSQYNRLFTERIYGYFRAEALHDGISDVHYRFTLSPGAGYYFIKNKTTSLRVEAGPGYINEKLGSETHSYMTLRFGEKFEHKLNGHARIWQTMEVLPEVRDFNNFIVNAEAGIESALSKAWNLRVVLQDAYDNVPAVGRQKNDLRLIAGLGYKF